ncbi:MarR family winged helix-turn-helix transcriptional regulator [Blastomonas sp.]|uniref:MarR family winged helix-turn-helix transcriptional regulator n=1 Tax=Blastomonas sp. TaxID=1909299 RepID=UPI0035930A07
MATTNNIATGLAKIGLFLRSANWRQAEAAALSPTQAQILIHLTRRGPARIAALAEELGVTQPTASDSAAALIRKGHLERRRDPADGRAALLHPTLAGLRTAEAIAVWPDALLAAVDALDAQEQVVFLKGLTKMIRYLQVKGAIPVQRMCATCRFFRPNVHDDAVAPHHCAFVDAAFGDANLRLDCSEHEPTDEPETDAIWRRFAGTPAGKADAPPAVSGEAS